MRPGRILKWTVLVFAAFLLALFLLALFSPRLSKTGWFQKHSLAYISSKSGGRLEWKAFKWSLFPSPHLKLSDVSFEKTDQFEASSGSIDIYPRFLSLLRGRIDLGRVVVEAPSIRVSRREDSQVEKPLAEAVVGLAGLGAALGSDASIHLRNGRLALSGGREPVLSFEGINGQIKFLDKEARFSLEAVSGWADGISLEGVFDQRVRHSKAKLGLQGFRPHQLLKILLPDAKTGLKDSMAQATFHLDVDGEGNIALEGEGSVARLSLSAGAKDVEIGFPTFSASARISGPEVSVVLHRLDVDREGGEVSGTIELSKHDPHISVRLVGKAMDVPRVRGVTLALFGKDEGVRIVFDVLRGGVAPEVTLTTRGNGLKDLALLSNLTIKGELHNGVINVPEVSLYLEDVSGQAVIQNGLLVASQAQARLGTAAQGRNGGLTLALEKGDDRFHLDVEVEADVGQFPVYLPRVLKDAPGLQELSLMEDLAGHASGRLVLGERLKGLGFSISVSSFHLTTRYGRVPFPVQLKGGSVKLTDEKLDFSHLSGLMGKSSLTDLGGTVRWGQAPFADIRSAKADVAMDEVGPWLQSEPGLSGRFTDVKDMKGALLLTELSLKGPLADAPDWQLEMAGQMRDFSCEVAGVSGPIQVREGEFSYRGSAAKGRLSLAGAQFLVSDAAMEVTGSVDHDLRSGFSADLTLKGDLGNDSMRALAHLAGLPPEYVPTSPLSIHVARFWRSNDGATRVSGDALLGGEVSVSLECLVTKQAVTINNLVVREGEAFAQMNVSWRDNTWFVVFKGDLEQRTLSKLLPKGPLGDGRLRGDFKAQVRPDHPLDSSIVGQLTIDGLSLPLGEKGSLKVSHCDMDAERDRITLESASVSVAGTPFEVKGEVWPVAGQLLVNLDVSAGSVVWSDLAKTFEGDGLKGRPLFGSGPTDLPVRGVVRLDSASVSYKGKSWVPFKAQLQMMDDGWTVEVKEANLCGISTPGVVELKSDPALFRVFPKAKGQALNPAMKCLLGEHMIVTGDFDLSGRLQGKLKEVPFSKGLSGGLAFRAHDGRIYRYELLSKIFAFLNLTELLRGKVPDMGKEGFAYNTMRAKAEMLNGKVAIREAIIDAKSMEIGCEGEVDLLRDQLDLRVLVAPLKTVDFIIKHIPGLNYILGGTLVSIPVRVSGQLADPTITPLSPSAVGAGLLGIMERAFMLPIKIIEPVLPEQKK